MNTNRWWLQLERLRDLRFGLSLHKSASRKALLGITQWVDRHLSARWEARALHAREAWGVWCGLAAQLGEVEIRAGFVADVHGFAELALGVVAVEDYAVDGYCDGFDDDFDDATDECPGLFDVSR